MAGFGAPSSPAKGMGGKSAKKKALSAKKQWSKYTSLLKEGKTVKVHAREQPNGEWELVGSVAFETTGTAEAAAFFQKRLILEHAKRMYPRLAVKQSSLECGIEGEDGAVTKVSKVEAADDLNCGFLGEPDQGGFYSRGNRVDKQLAASGAAPNSDSKGRLG